MSVVIEMNNKGRQVRYLQDSERYRTSLFNMTESDSNIHADNNKGILHLREETGVQRDW